MGCDIHSFAERKNSNGQWEHILELEPFQDRNYSVFAWLADVRNGADVPAIAAERDIPEDACAESRECYEEMDCDAHSPSWVSLAELLAFDYEALFKDRRYSMRPTDAGRMTSYRDFLGEEFFEDLEALKSAGAERVVFFFDN